MILDRNESKEVAVLFAYDEFNAPGTTYQNMIDTMREIVSEDRASSPVVQKSLTDRDLIFITACKMVALPDI